MPTGGIELYCGDYGRRMDRPSRAVQVANDGCAGAYSGGESGEFFGEALSHKDKTAEAEAIESSAFEALEKDFQEVLQELIGDKPLEHFRLEYEKLHRALKNSPIKKKTGSYLNISPCLGSHARVILLYFHPFQYFLQ